MGASIGCLQRHVTQGLENRERRADKQPRSWWSLQLEAPPRPPSVRRSRHRLGLLMFSAVTQCECECEWLDAG